MTEHRYIAQVGAISSGTLRTEDLLARFAEELERLARGCEHPGNKQTYDELVAEAREFARDDEGEANEQFDGARDEVLDMLSCALGEFAPPYCYFGSHEGDGACFGFWPNMLSIGELPRVVDGDAARALGEDCVCVNDHGNVTVFGGDGRVLLELV